MCTLENQQCVGKFAADMELCCRDPLSPYPVLIPVYIRGHPPVSSQYQASLPPNPLAQVQQSGTHSGTPVTPSIGVGNLDEQSSSMGKKTSRARIPSAGQSVTLAGLTGIDYDSRSYSVVGLWMDFTLSSKSMILAFLLRTRTIEGLFVWLQDVSLAQG